MSYATGRAKAASRKRGRSAGGNGGTSDGTVSRAFGSGRDHQQAGTAAPDTAGPRVAMPLQRQVTVSEPGDAHEREADTVASRVVAGGSVGPISPLGPADTKEEAEPPVHGPLPVTEPPAGQPVTAPAPGLAQRQQTPPPENRKPEEERNKAQRLVQRAMAPVEDHAGKVQRAIAPAAGKDAQLSPDATMGPGAGQVQRVTPEAAKAEPEPQAGRPVAQRATASMENPASQVQRRASPGAQTPDGKVQASAAGGAGTAGGAGATGAGAPGGPTPAAASAAIAAPGPGRTIAPSTRSVLESRMGVDLAGVRIHDDTAAHEAARSIDSRAFTHGDDIWLGRGESPEDLHLMAHEATHVAQQRGGVQRAAIQRAETSAEEGDMPIGKGSINTQQGKMKIPQIDVPPIKKPFTKEPLKLRKGGRPDNTKQRENWLKSVGDITDLVKARTPSLESVDQDGTKVYFLQHHDGYVIGSEQALADKLRRPTWDREGRFTYFDVDHRLELQLGGEDDEENVWLLESSANRSAGALINNEINRKIKALLDKVPNNVKGKPDVATAREKYDIEVLKVGKSDREAAGHPDRHYVADDVKRGKSFDPLRSLSKREIKRAGGSSDRIALFSTPVGGRRTEVVIENGVGKKVHGKDSWRWGNLLVTSITYGDDPKSRKVEGIAFKDDRWVTEVPVWAPIEPIPGVQWGGWVSPRQAKPVLSEKLQVKGASPVELDDIEIDFDQGIMAAGRLLPTIPLIKDIPIDLRIGARGISLSKTFSAGALKFPGPIKVKGSTLEIELGTRGLAVLGEVPFEIERLGQGRIFGAGSAGGEGVHFELGGEFDFDTELFKPAQIKAWYRDRKFGGAGKLGIPEGKVRGIKSAALDVTFDEDRIEAHGTVEVAFKGVQRGSLTVVYDRAAGLQIAGTLELANDIPGVRNGKLSASLKQKPEGGWALGGGISAEVGIPGLAATITGSYQDGVFQIEGTAGYEKGFLKGTVTIGATNRAVGPDGRPSGEDAGLALGIRRRHRHRQVGAVATGDRRAQNQAGRRDRRRRQGRTAIGPPDLPGKEAHPEHFQGQLRHPDRRVHRPRAANRHLRHHRGRAGR